MRPSTRELSALVDAGHDEAVDLRRDLHANPELSSAERRTSDVLRDRLVALGLSDAPCPTATGVVAILDGGRPGRTVLLRADIDALPVEEAVEVPYRSRVAGVMHACGHDAHAAIAVAAAAVLAARVEDLDGRVAVVMQPAEETISGALAMVEGGLLEQLRPDRVVGCHVSSLFPTGLVSIRPGIAMAAARTVRIDIRGRAGHIAINGGEGSVVLAAAALVTRLGSSVAGLEYLEQPCVAAAGLVHAGTASNVVPLTARVEGSLRTFTPDQHDEALVRLRALCDEVAAEHDVTMAVTELARTQAVVNDPATAARLTAVAASAVGAGNVFEAPPVAPSDDVSELLARVPGVYMHLGARPGARVPPVHHAPDFAIDEEVIRVGALLLAASAVSLLAAE